VNAITHAPEYAIGAGAAVAVLALLRLAWRLGRLGIGARGRAPLAAGIAVLGKLAAVVPVVVLALAVRTDMAQARPDGVVRRGVAALLVLAGAALAAAALATLDTSTRVGLPREETVLETGGVYRLSRNPMYLAIMTVHLAALTYAPGPWTIVPALISFAIHHRIVLAEERFLGERFGAQYAAYRERVRRYF
jgi:protein-S-isoprenylcysteine O-methyltransferase Ste14